MTTTATDVVRTLLGDSTNPDLVNRLVAPDATHASLNHDNPELRRLMPWTGTRTGPEAVLDTYTHVRRDRHGEAFEIEGPFGEGGNGAVSGRFTHRSATPGRAITSPFAILAEVADGRITHMRFMEDICGTASTVRSGGTATYRSDPDGGEVSP